MREREGVRIWKAKMSVPKQMPTGLIRMQKAMTGRETGNGSHHPDWAVVVRLHMDSCPGPSSRAHSASWTSGPGAQDLMGQVGVHRRSMLQEHAWTHGVYGKRVYREWRT